MAVGNLWIAVGDWPLSGQSRSNNQRFQWRIPIHDNQWNHLPPPTNQPLPVITIEIPGQEATPCFEVSMEINNIMSQFF